MIHDPADTTHSHPADLHTAIAETRSPGQRAADLVAAQMGSWRFLIVQSAILLAWIALNTTELLFHPWDLYPFILLNLCLSFQAAYSAPIIMMSQNRAAQIDRAHAENAYHQIAEIDQIQAEQLTLLALQHDQLELLQSIKTLATASDIALKQVVSLQSLVFSQETKTPSDQQPKTKD